MPAIYSTYQYDQSFYNKAGDWALYGAPVILANTVSTTINSTVGQVSKFFGVSDTAEIVRNSEILPDSAYEFYQQNKGAADTLTFLGTAVVGGLGIAKAANYIGRSSSVAKAALAGDTAAIGNIAGEVSGLTYGQKLNSLLEAQKQVASAVASGTPIGSLSSAKLSYVASGAIDWFGQGLAGSYLNTVIQNQNSTIYADKNWADNLFIDPLVDGLIGGGLGAVGALWSYGKLIKKSGIGEQAISQNNKLLAEGTDTLGLNISAGTELASSAIHYANLARQTGDAPAAYSRFAKDATESADRLTRQSTTGISPADLLKLLDQDVNKFSIETAERFVTSLAGAKVARKLSLTDDLTDSVSVPKIYKLAAVEGNVVREVSSEEAAKLSASAAKEAKIYAITSDGISLEGKSGKILQQEIENSKNSIGFEFKGPQSGSAPANVLDLEAGGTIVSGQLYPNLGDFLPQGAKDLVAGQRIELPSIYSQLSKDGKEIFQGFTVPTAPTLPDYRQVTAESSRLAGIEAQIAYVNAKPSLNVGDLPGALAKLRELKSSDQTITFTTRSNLVQRDRPVAEFREAVKQYQDDIISDLQARGISQDITEQIAFVKFAEDGTYASRTDPKKFLDKRFAVIEYNAEELSARASPSIQNGVREWLEIRREQARDIVSQVLPNLAALFPDRAFGVRDVMKTLNSTPNLLAIRQPVFDSIESSLAQIGKALETSIGDFRKATNVIGERALKQSQADVKVSAEIAQIAQLSDGTVGTLLVRQDVDGVVRIYSPEYKKQADALKKEIAAAEKQQNQKLYDEKTKELAALGNNGQLVTTPKYSGDTILQFAQEFGAEAATGNKLRYAKGLRPKTAHLETEDAAGQFYPLYFSPVDHAKNSEYTLYLRLPPTIVDGTAVLRRFDFKNEAQFTSAREAISQQFSKEISEGMQLIELQKGKKLGSKIFGTFDRGDINLAKHLEGEYEASKDILVEALDVPLIKKGVQFQELGNSGDATTSILRLLKGLQETGAENRRLGAELFFSEEFSRLKSADRLYQLTKEAGLGANNNVITGALTPGNKRSNATNQGVPPTSPYEALYRIGLNLVSRDSTSAIGAASYYTSKAIDLAWDNYGSALYNGAAKIFGAVGTQLQTAKSATRNTATELAKLEAVREAQATISAAKADFATTDALQAVFNQIAGERVKTFPKLAKAVQTLNTVQNAFVLRQDFFNAAVNALSSPQTASFWIKQVTQETAAANGGKLPEAFNARFGIVDGQGDTLMSQSKIFARAVAASAKRDSSDPLVAQVLAAMPDPRRSQYLQAGMDDMYAASKDLAYGNKVQEAIEKLENNRSWYNVFQYFPRANDFVEEQLQFIGRYMAADVGEALGRTAGQIRADMSTAAGALNTNTLAAFKHPFWHSTIGQALGLFQTYQLNMVGRFLRAADVGDAKLPLTMLGLNAVVGGLKGTPYVDSLNKIIASKDPDHTDLYARINQVVGTDVADFFIYGPVSNLTGAAVYSRANATPGGIFSFDLPPQVRLISDNLTVLSKAVKDTVGGQSSAYTNFLQGLEHQTFNRPLSGVGTLLQGRRTTKEGANITSVQETAQNTNFIAEELALGLGAAIRVGGVRPLNEAIFTDLTYRYGDYKKKDQEALKNFGRQIALAVNGTKQEDLLENSDFYQKAKADYLRIGGNPKEFQTFLTRQFNKADKNPLLDVSEKFHRPEVLQNIARSLGADTPRGKQVIELLNERQAKE